jgi:hypothetical protein
MSVWNEQVERLAIRELLENWVVWRDAGDWDRFKTIWHEDGRMMATWFQGAADDFIRVSREGFERGVRIVHFLGGISIDLAGPRAIGQAKMTINQRAMVEGIECDAPVPAGSTIFWKSGRANGASFFASRSTKRIGSIQLIPRRL